MFIPCLSHCWPPRGRRAWGPSSRTGRHLRLVRGDQGLAELGEKAASRLGSMGPWDCLDDWWWLGMFGCWSQLVLLGKHGPDACLDALKLLGCLSVRLQVAATISPRIEFASDGETIRSISMFCVSQAWEISVNSVLRMFNYFQEMISRTNAYNLYSMHA